MRKPLTDRALAEKLPSWGVLVLESHHSPQFTMEWRTHSFVKIVFVLNGKGTFHIGRQKTSFQAGDVVVVPPRTRNRIEDDPTSAASLYIGCVSASLLKFDPWIIGHLPTGQISVGAQVANRVASTLRRMVYSQDREPAIRSVAMVADAMRLIQLIQQTAAHTTIRSGDQYASNRQAIHDYVQTLKSEFFEATTIDHAAASLDLPRRSFTKLFAEETGQTWLQFVRELAISYAKERLRTTEVPIPSVAFECGFNDLSTFYRQFKTQVGMSPAKYRVLNSGSTRM